MSSSFGSGGAMESEPGPGRLTVVGAGVMGAGITALAMGYGLSVHLVDVEQARLAQAGRRIRQQLRHAQLLGALPGDQPAGELETSTSIASAGRAFAIVEAVSEQPELKRKVLAEAAAVVGPGTPLISNTSGIPIDELAGGLPSPEWLVGTHFMNPTYLINMVEVVRGRRTGDLAVSAVESLLVAMNRTWVVVSDAPGFVTSRLLHPMINQAARLVERGTASADAVDALLQGCLGHPTGPLRTADLIGIDNLVDSLDALYERTGEQSCLPCDLLREKVANGELGCKAGRGFYEHGEVAP